LRKDCTKDWRDRTKDLTKNRKERTTKDPKNLEPGTLVLPGFFPAKDKFAHQRVVRLGQDAAVREYQ
jgi:hypothetical protein